MMFNTLTVETSVELLLQKDLFGCTLLMAHVLQFMSGRMKIGSANVDLSTRWCYQENGAGN
jgi:hypothetical protein